MPSLSYFALFLYSTQKFLKLRNFVFVVSFNALISKRKMKKSRAISMKYIKKKNEPEKRQERTNECKKKNMKNFYINFKQKAAYA